MARSSFPMFGERLRGLFKARGITNQSAFARDHGFNQGKVSRWLRGSVPESEDDLERLAMALGTTPAELLAGQKTEGAPPRPQPVITAFNSVPKEIRDAVEQLWQGQARLLSQFAETVWRRATERAAQPTDQSAEASGAKVGRRSQSRRSGT